MTAIRRLAQRAGCEEHTGPEDDLQQRAAPFEQPPLYREYTYRDIVVPDGIPAIVPQDLFDRVQEKLAKNKRPRPATRPRTIIC